MNLQKYICILRFFWEAGREPAIHVKHRTCMTHDCMAVWQEKMGQTNRKEKYIAYRGLILFYHRGKGLLGATLAIFFLASWEAMGNPMNGTENNDKTKQNNDVF